MKIVFIVGSHPRHSFMARAVAQRFPEMTLIIEQRGCFVPEPDAALSPDLKRLFKTHFFEREAAEEKHFGALVWPSCEQVVVSQAQLNGPEVHQVIKAVQPDLLLSYGCHKLSDETLAQAPGSLKWNIHGGLSPWYKGAITHFWPSYMLEPQMTGMTLHETTAKLDAGAVVHQNVADLVLGDGLHDLAARAVCKMAVELPRVIELANTRGPLSLKSHQSSGMLWRSQLWRPEHLRLIYEVYANKIVDAYLNGEFVQRPPQIYQQCDVF